MAPLGQKIAPHVGDAARRVADALGQGGRVLAEGAQGTMLDLDHGTYPFVTSSSATAGGACTGAGIPPTSVRGVIGIAKAYTTRVGGGPFPTELLDDVGERLRKAGAEFGATTGRPRRCGWLDAVVLRHAVRVNGLSEIVLTKLDVLAGIDPIRIAVGYDLDGRRIDAPPPDGIERVVPVYEELPGFPEDVARATSRDQLPDNARRYIDRVAELAGCTLRVVSVGPGREQTLNLADPFP
jgi:adenylosuccinate synthase